MGDTDPKNIHKLEEKKHEDHLKQEQEKHKNAERQHSHPDHLPHGEHVADHPKAESKES